MKKLISFLLVITLILGLSVPALAQDAKQHPYLTQNQMKILKEYGLSEKEIAEIDIEGIRNVLKYGIRNVGKSDWDKNKITPEIKDKLEKKNLSESKVNQLNNRGYTYAEIADMDTETVENLLGPVTIMSAPAGYNGPVTVPDGGGSNEYFHWNVSVDASALDWYASASKMYAQYHFDEYSNPLPSNLRWSYYLYGEWDDSKLTHQGVDVQHSNGRPVKNVIGNSLFKGEVIAATGTSLNGYVQVYDSYLDVTVTYMHIGTPKVSRGQYILAGEVIGSQSSSTGHTHFQAVDGKTTSIPAASYNTLSTRSPYSIMTWYIY